MIRINLAQKKQASYLGGSKTASFASGGKTGTMTALRGLMSGGAASATTTALAKILIPLILSVGAYYAYDYYTGQKLAEMQQEVNTLDQEKTRIQNELRKIKGYEVVKTELERNEMILRTKIQTIEKLILGRDFTVKSLVVLSQSLPKAVWLTDLSATETAYDLKGGTTDISLVSDLMTRLGGTIYYKDVTLKSTAADPGQRMATFELSARRE